MQFQTPSFLYALFTLLIPVIIHLFYFRRYRQVVFGDIRFLKQIDEVSKSKRRLRDWLILICRLMFLTFLVLAFARPYIPNHSMNNIQQNSAVIYVDNSFSMLNEGAEGPLIETAKSKARAIVNSLGNEVSYLFLTNNKGNTRWLSKAEAIRKIDETVIVPYQKTIGQIQREVQNTQVGRTGSKINAFLISDFQSEGLDAMHWNVDTNYNWRVFLTQSNLKNNLFLDSVWLKSPAIRKGKPVELICRLSNASPDDVGEVNLVMKINGIQKGLRKVKLRAGGTTDELFRFETSEGWQEGELSIEDYPITFDDRLYFTLKHEGKSKVLTINGGRPCIPLQRLFSEDPDFSYQEVGQDAVDYAALNTFQFIVLNEPRAVSNGLMDVLKKAVDQGTRLFIVPPSGGNIDQSVNVLLSQFGSVTYQGIEQNDLRLMPVSKQDPFYRDVFIRIPENPDMPVVKQYYRLAHSAATPGRSLLQLNNSQPFMWIQHSGFGTVVVSSVPWELSYSDFHQHAWFVPTLLNLAMGSGIQSPLYHNLGEGKPVPIDLETTGQKLLTISGNGFNYTGEGIFRSGKTFFNIPAPLDKPGIYTISTPNRPGSDIDPEIMKVAFNYNRRESLLKTDQPEDLIKAGVSQISIENSEALKGTLLAETSGKPLWRWMLIFAVFFILTEMALLRLMK